MIETTFVFDDNSDNKGNLYLNCYSNLVTLPSIATIKGRCFETAGNPKIVVRTGSNSRYGKELLFQFLIKKHITSYRANSKYDTLEYYLPLEEGILFLEQSLLYLKSKLAEK